MVRRSYSRWASVEEKKNVRSAVRFGILTLVTITLLFFFGVPAVGKFAAFVSDLAKGQKPITRTDNTPPAPPQINTVPEFTNQKSVKLTGSSEEGATVKLTFNSSEEEVVAGKNGEFSFDLKLIKGVNKFEAIAVDTAGNESQKTKEYKITFDDESPELTIDSPDDGHQFYGSHERQVQINGKTEEGVNVTVNDKYVSVESDGTFQFTTTLNEGENKFNVKATDQSGNVTEKELTLNFTP